MPAGELNKQRGFTLIELLVTLMIAAIIAVMAVPAFAGFLARQRLASDVNELISVLSFARSEAIKQRQPVLVAFLPPDDCDDVEGVDEGNDRQQWCYRVQREDDDEIMRVGQSANITTPDQAFSLIFQSLGDADIDGCGASTCNVTLTPQRDNIDPVTLVINTTGSIRRGEP
ncbi:GspH/FimT family pseudopilin [Halomonas alkaliantarctica]|uniref:Type II secretion system protein H n=1 Tax=Halomonas alkaliantarctica TaxID=232346 RepID=A0ABY8LM09_9GAMM|nr:GspH/FimT family pseudopilin [Halomonas alkaliantarctica]WGI24876.1 GspH/FimT family pseudopilin [Halomonas alkaliantarctica]